MIKKLTPIGNSLGIIIERPILELLGIDRNTPLEVKTDGKGLIIRPAVSEHGERVKGAAMRLMDAHDDTFKKLAQ